MFVRSFVIMALIGAAPAHGPAADGWAAGTTGGAGAPPGSVFVVHDRAELLAALDYGGNPTGTKIISVAGTIHGNETADGRLVGEQDYAPGGFGGRTVQRHDGLLDIDGTDFVTVSYSRFTDHDKALLIGSGDGRADRDRGHLRITFHHNLFRNTLQRSPRVRFGEMHTYNNLFLGSTRDRDYPMTSEALGGHHYFLGMGIESKIVSEYNAFGYDTRVDPADVTVANYSGYQFVDRGSWVNGRPAGLVTVAARKFDAAASAARSTAEANGTALPEWATMQFTTDVGWDPADEYSYRPQRSAAAVTATVLREAGAGRVR